MFKRRDSFFPPAEKIVKRTFQQMRTPVIAAIGTNKESIKGVNAAIKSFEPQTLKMIQSIWIMAGNDGYKFAAENFGSHQQKVAAWLSYVAGYMNTQGGAKIKGITAETQDLIQHALFAGMEQEESIPELTDRVQGVFDGMEDWRATRIARSETVDAYNQATLQQGRDAGSTLDIMWIATDDDRTRPAHAAMDGQTIPHDQTEGFDCEDGTNWPGEAVNCRCTIGHAVPEAGEAPTAEEPAAEGAPEVYDNYDDAYKAFDEYAATLSDEDKQLITDYTTTNFMETNLYLRGENAELRDYIESRWYNVDPTTAEGKRIIDDYVAQAETDANRLRELIQNAPKYDGPVYRSVWSDNKELFDYLIDGKGNDLTLNGMVSTSTSEDAANKMLKLSSTIGGEHPPYEINYIIDNGNGAVIQPLSGVKQYKLQEVLIDHGHEYHIKDVKLEYAPGKPGTEIGTPLEVKAVTVLLSML